MQFGYRFAGIALASRPKERITRNGATRDRNLDFDVEGKGSCTASRLEIHATMRLDQLADYVEGIWATNAYDSTRCPTERGRDCANRIVGVVAHGSRSVLRLLATMTRLGDLGRVTSYDLLCEV